VARTGEDIQNTSNAQDVLRIHNELDALRYKEGEDWNKHVTKLIQIVSRLATFDEELSENEKTSKLLRTLPDSYTAIAIVAQTVNMDFEKLVISVHAEVARKMNIS